MCEGVEIYFWKKYSKSCKHFVVKIVVKIVNDFTPLFLKVDLAQPFSRSYEGCFPKSGKSI